MNKTLIVVILDESGSMSHTRLEVIDGFNTFIEAQKLVNNDIARLTLVKFNTCVTTVYSGLDLQIVPEMTLKDYSPNGFTALYDSVRVGVNYADIDKKIDERVIVMIMTDGQENSSSNTNSRQIREIITEREARGDWTFIYIGEDVENWVRNSGMSRSNAAQFSDRSATHNFRLTGESISQFRSSGERNSDDLIENSLLQGL